MEKLRRVGTVLQAKFKDNVDPAFEHMVKTGKFTKRSVSLYPDLGNGPSLRHVGFVGAKPPVVKGLADIQFGEEDKKAIEIEFSEETEMAELNSADQQSIVDGVVAKLKGLFKSHSPATEEKTFSEDDVKRIAGEAVKESVKTFETRLAAQEVKFAERETSLVTAERKSRAEAAIARVKSKGAWVPAFDKLGLPLLFAELATSTQTVEFGEGAEKKKEAPLEILVNFMEASKAIVPTGTVYTGQQAARPRIANVNGNADANSIQFAEKIDAHMLEHKVDYSTAMNAVANAHPELTVAGGAAAGAV